MCNRSPRRSTIQGVSFVEHDHRFLFKPFLLLLLLCLTAAAGAPREAHAVLMQIDTSALSGIGRFEFSLLDGDGTAPNNSVTISGNSIQDVATTNKDQALGNSVNF